MGSDKVDAWIKKNPKSWAKLAESKKKKLSFEEFKKKFKQGARREGKNRAVDNMTNAQIHEIYLASDKSIKTGRSVVIEEPNEKTFKTKKITVKRGKQTYTRTITPRWNKYTRLSLSIAITKKPRSKEYNEIVSTLVKTTGRTRRAVTTKIYRERKKNKKENKR